MDVCVAIKLKGALFWFLFVSNYCKKSCTFFIRMEKTKKTRDLTKLSSVTVF